MILGSSAVERSTVNRLVAGSNPARGVHFNVYTNSGDPARDLFLSFIFLNSIFYKNAGNVVGMWWKKYIFVVGNLSIKNRQNNLEKIISEDSSI